MGMYFRKSVNVGPFRFNLSKSGIGMSAGVPGLRVGTGPRGNYIHMGKGGIYYKKSFPKSSENTKVFTKYESDLPNPVIESDIPADTHEDLIDIDSGDVSSMVDSSSQDLVNELNQKIKKIRLWPIVMSIGLILISYLIVNDFPNLVVILTAALATISLCGATYRDLMSKSVVMLYDIEDEFQIMYDSLHSAFKEMSSSKKSWHMEAEGQVKDKKYHAGADNVVRRREISLSLKNPPCVKTNILTPSIPVGKQTLYFFPDMVLIFEPGGVGAVSYKNLNVDVRKQRFIEDESVPKDSKIIDYTWRYVNKRGGPDKRFKNNTQIPIVLYEDIYFTSSTGLNERIEISKTGISAPFASAIKNVGRSNQAYG
ncbi:DUF4236 domain-containing protein [Sessilibacter corallicola]|uniref:DUF4236 domain-containing protein n=1 Tax=Sessilibacter corallicola TaxID=2904075 RepID=A0ABQ0AF95_9GAMM